MNLAIYKENKHNQIPDKLKNDISLQIINTEAQMLEHKFQIGTNTEHYLK